MASKKKNRKKVTSRRLPRVSKGPIGGPRKCGVCGKRGHNSRSHEPGGKFR